MKPYINREGPNMREAIYIKQTIWYGVKIMAKKYNEAILFNAIWWSYGYSISNVY